MFHYRPLQYALLFSLTIHAVILTIFSVYHLRHKPPMMRQIEVTYASAKPKKLSQPVQPPVKDMMTFKERKASQNLDILSKNKPQSSPISQDVRHIEKSRDVIQVERKKAPKITTFDKEKRIDVALSRSDKITNPQYLNYKEKTSQKIRQQLLMSYDKDKFTKAGNVYITFLLDSSGNLRDIKIIESKTRATDYLKNIALKSVKDSSPFIDFPKELHYENLTFNLEIAFVGNEDEN